MRVTAKTMLVFGLLMTSFAAPALADSYGRCGSVPNEQWMKVDQVAAKVAERGYTVRSIEPDDGCWEVDVRDNDGRRLDLHVHPVTAEIVSTDYDD